MVSPFGWFTVRRFGSAMRLMIRLSSPLRVCGRDEHGHDSGGDCFTSGKWQVNVRHGFQCGDELIRRVFGSRQNMHCNGTVEVDIEPELFGNPIAQSDWRLLWNNIDPFF